MAPLRRCCRRGRNGEVRALEVVRCEVGDVETDGLGELRDGFLDLDGVVVGFGAVDLGDPGMGMAHQRLALVTVSNANEIWLTHLRRASWAWRRASTLASRSLYSVQIRR